MSLINLLKHFYEVYELAVRTKVLQMCHSLFQSDFRVVQQVYGGQRASKVASH